MLSEIKCSEQTPSTAAFQSACEQLEQMHATLVGSERLAALARMATGMAHGLSNSLTPIIGYSDFLLEGEAPNPEQATKCLRAIRSAAGDIAAMVERIRLFYRTRNPDEPLTPVDLNAIVRDVIASVQPQWQELAQRRGILISIETRLSSELPHICENESELRDAVSQLVINGFEAMPRGGTLAISTRELEVRSNPNEPGSTQVVLEVRDNGIGMDAAMCERCFEPFISTKGSRGCGLGLPVVYGLMRRHGGTIQLDSEPGQGTAVRLFFEATPAVAKQSNGISTGTNARRPRTAADVPLILHS